MLCRRGLMGDMLRRLVAGVVLHGLARRHLRRGGRGRQPAELDLNQSVDCLKLALEVLEPRIMLLLELIEQLVELSLVGVDLLFKQAGPVLQIPADITHCLPLVRIGVRTTERAGAVSRKTK